MNKIIEIIPTLYWASLGFFSVYRFTSPIYSFDREDIYAIKMDTIINKIDNIERKLK